MIYLQTKIDDTTTTRDDFSKHTKTKNNHKNNINIKNDNTSDGIHYLEIETGWR